MTKLFKTLKEMQSDILKAFPQSIIIHTEYVLYSPHIEFFDIVSGKRYRWTLANGVVHREEI